jgi:chromosome segregation and condensation protein ScpB
MSGACARSHSIRSQLLLIRDELRGRPYELVTVAGGWQHRTRKAFASAIQIAIGLGDEVRPLFQQEAKQQS